MATKSDLQAALKSARERASRVGPMHALWDTIFDAEAFLVHRPLLGEHGCTHGEIIDSLTRELPAT
jgi:hypothetical protein